MLKTIGWLQRAKRDKKIYRHYQRLLTAPGAMASSCAVVISEKYGVSVSTVYNITRRMKQPSAQTSTDF